LGTFFLVSFDLLLKELVYYSWVFTLHFNLLRQQSKSCFKFSLLLISWQGSPPHVNSFFQIAQPFDQICTRTALLYFFEVHVIPAANLFQWERNSPLFIKILRPFERTHRTLNSRIGSERPFSDFRYRATSYVQYWGVITQRITRGDDAGAFVGQFAVSFYGPPFPLNQVFDGLERGDWRWGKRLLRKTGFLVLDFLRFDQGRHRKVEFCIVVERHLRSAFLQFFW